ncbi:MAG: hypothetical protein AB1416_10535 [Actinomycetota bacterium]
MQRRPPRPSSPRPAGERRAAARQAAGGAVLPGSRRLPLPRARPAEERSLLEILLDMPGPPDGPAPDG